ncbi:CheY-P phosphatase CheX [Phycisphaerae bacterium RAS1]|nr:CheY-P phosphatase CheX [Phycisphaerae bacterium RAS1]
MDVRYVNPFVSAIKRVFETMVHTPVTIGKPMLKDHVTFSPDVSGVIGFSGDAAGCVVLSFGLDVACRAVERFAGANIDPTNPDFSDAIGELANMVAGNAKTEFDGMNISISLPSVILGKDHTVSVSRNPPRIVIPCQTAYGTLYVEIGMTLIRKPATARPLATTGAR